MAADIVHTLDLKEAVAFGGAEVTKLEFVKPRAKHFRRLGISQSNTVQLGEILDVAAMICNQPPSLINELGIEDTFRVLGVIQGFLPTGLTIG